jgi:hypothetical protein
MRASVKLINAFFFLPSPLFLCLYLLKNIRLLQDILNESFMGFANLKTSHKKKAIIKKKKHSLRCPVVCAEVLWNLFRRKNRQAATAATTATKSERNGMILFD